MHPNVHVLLRALHGTPIDGDQIILVLSGIPVLCKIGPHAHHPQPDIVGRVGCLYCKQWGIEHIEEFISMRCTGEHPHVEEYLKSVQITVISEFVVVDVVVLILGKYFYAFINAIDKNVVGGVLKIFKKLEIVLNDNVK